MNVSNFFSKWLKDLIADQMPNGSVPHVIPNVFVPTKNVSAVSESGGFVILANATIKDGYLVFTLGSGNYHFNIMK